MKNTTRCRLLTILLAVLPIAISSAADDPAIRRADTLRLPENARSVIAKPIAREAIRATAAQGQLVIDPNVLRSIGTVRNASELIATDLKGNAIATSRIAGNQLSIASKLGQWVVVKPKTVETATMQAGLQWLPGACIPPSENAEEAAANTLFSYASFAFAPVVWDAAENAYTIVASIGVARNRDQSISGHLGTTATVKLAFDGIIADPSELQIDQLGLTGEKTVTIRFKETRSPKPRIIVRSSVAAEQAFEVDVRPRLALFAEDNPILGLGLEETTVSVRCVDASGLVVPSGANQPLDVVLGGARRDSDEALMFSHSADTRFKVRSVAFAPVKVRASTQTATDRLVGNLTIRTTMPWPQIVAVLLGGMLGGFSRRFVKGARKAKAGVHIVEGLAMSIIAFVAGVLGVGYLQVPAAIVATVAGAFLTGALSGFIGVLLLEKLSGKSTPAESK